MRDMFNILSVDKLKILKVNSVINCKKKYSKGYQHDQTEKCAPRGLINDIYNFRR